MEFPNNIESFSRMVYDLTAITVDLGCGLIVPIVYILLAIPLVLLIFIDIGWDPSRIRHGTKEPPRMPEQPYQRRNKYR